jgi:hypothetical protein
MESALLVIAALVIVFNFAFVAGALWANWVRSVRSDGQDTSGLSDSEPAAMAAASGRTAIDGVGKPGAVKPSRRSNRPSPESHLMASHMRRRQG